MSAPRLRIAPSPTGIMHIGTVRTALFNYLYAKQGGGAFIVRIEDTDKERNKPEYEDAIWRDLSWCGLEPDERYRQSEHIDRHREEIQLLLRSDAAYLSKEPSKKDPGSFVEVVRLRNRGRSITFDDMIRGEVTFDTSDLGDFVIARSIDDPLYHLAVVVDDADEGITHVLRAEEHLSNTPRQILIQEALGYPRPAYGHVPLILAPDRSKLSKRKHHAGIDFYRDAGYVPEALLNYLALLGWNPGGERELFTLPELVAEFDIGRIQKAGAIFDAEKLKWFNRQYLLQLPEKEFEATAGARLEAALDRAGIRAEATTLQALVPLLKERIHVWQDIDALVETGELEFFFNRPQVEPRSIPQKGTAADEAKRHLQNVAELLRSVHESKSGEHLKDIIMKYADKEGRGVVLWPVRYALTGRSRSPDPFSIISVIGTSESIARLDAAASAL